MNDAAAELEFEDRSAFRKWLSKNHASSEGIWLILRKGSKALSANDALEEAICFGWIDGLMKSIDEKTYKKYFSKRKAKGNWSDKNRKLHQKLSASGLMTEAGADAYSEKAEGTAAGPRPDAHAANIAALRESLGPDPEALRLFGLKPPSRQKQFAGFFCDAKGEQTCKRRLAKIVDALKKGYEGMLY